MLGGRHVRGWYCMITGGKNWHWGKKKTKTQRMSLAFKFTTPEDKWLSTNYMSGLSPLPVSCLAFFANNEVIKHKQK